MPTYEYRCETCGKSFEMLQSFTDKPLRRHTECGGKVEKVFHPRGVVFKGSGFYVNDSRAKASAENGGSKKSNGSSKSESTSSDSGVAADKPAVASDSNKSD